MDDPHTTDARTSCLFCKIASGEISSEKVYEDAHTFAFLDIRPNNPGHTLVIPKAHAPNLYEISEESLSATMAVVKKVAIAAKKAMGADGINIAMNNDPAAGQVIFHAHVHVIPRFADDGYRHWPQKSYKEGEAAEVASKIRAHLI